MTKSTPKTRVVRRPLKGEGSGKFIQRLWMAGVTDPDGLAALVRKYFEGRTTTRADVAFNVTQLRKVHGPKNVPAWPTARAA